MLSTHWTVAQRVKFAEESASGTADANTAAGFTELVEQAREDGVDAIAAPTSRVIWVNAGYRDAGCNLTRSCKCWPDKSHGDDMVAEV